VSNSRNETYLKAFGIRLRDLRLEKKLSQNKLSILTDIPISQVGRIERGEVNPTLNTILLLSISLEIEPKDLLDFPVERNLG